MSKKLSRSGSVAASNPDLINTKPPVEEFGFWGGEFMPLFVEPNEAYVADAMVYNYKGELCKLIVSTCALTAVSLTTQEVFRYELRCIHRFRARGTYCPPTHFTFVFIDPLMPGARAKGRIEGWGTGELVTNYLREIAFECSDDKVPRDLEWLCASLFTSFWQGFFEEEVMTHPHEVYQYHALVSSRSRKKVHKLQTVYVAVSTQSLWVYKAKPTKMNMLIDGTAQMSCALSSLRDVSAPTGDSLACVLSIRPETPGKEKADKAGKTVYDELALYFDTTTERDFFMSEMHRVLGRRRTVNFQHQQQ